MNDVETRDLLIELVTYKLLGKYDMLEKVARRKIAKLNKRIDDFEEGHDQ